VNPESRYQVIGQLAQGGMGEILLARRLGAAGFEKLVVLKRPLARARGSAALVTALIEEARLLARINHPNVCQVHDLEEADGEYFLALEYLEGLSLWAVLADPGKPPRPVPPRVLCALFAQACDGLDAIHALRDSDGQPIGAVHRDISPGNLFVTEAGTLKILDLGIAKTHISEDKTPFGNVKGKLPYLSPEQVRGKTVDLRADLFSLGLVLHDVARGVRPIPDRVGALACDDLDLASLPATLASVIRRATATDADARFASARDMRAALYEAAGALGGMPTQGEIADWLAAHGAEELAAHRKRLRITRDEDSGEVTEILTLRSAIGVEPLGTQPNALAGSPSRMTERLELPDEDRVARPARTEAPPRRRPRWILPALGALVLIGGGVIAILIATANTGMDREPPPVAMQVQAQPAPPPPAPPQPAPAPPGPAPAPAPIAHVEAPTPAPRPVPHHHEPAREPPGQLWVDSQPYAEVRLGARSLGPTPIHIPVAPGHYRLHAATADGREQDLSVEIESGHDRKLRLNWSQK
jgi:serine/threonine-protein kinase